MSTKSLTHTTGGAKRTTRRKASSKTRGTVRKSSTRKTTTRKTARKTTRRLSSGKKKMTLSLRANGYIPSLPMGQRHLVLVRMVRHGTDPNDIIRRLRHLAAYVRMTDPARYLDYKTDAEWAMRNLLLSRLMQSSSSSSGTVRRRRVVKRKASSPTRKRTTVRRSKRTTKRRVARRK